MATHLRILALTVTTATAETTYRFDQPATVISGPSGAGKSSLLMLLKHAVGGTAVLTPAVRDHVLSVLASVVVGEQHMILKRTISGDRSDRVDILDPETMALQQTFGTRAEEGQRSLSDVLLGFPRESIPTTSLGTATTLNLTFTHLFRYAYLGLHVRAGSRYSVAGGAGGALCSGAVRVMAELLSIGLRVAPPGGGPLRTAWTGAKGTGAPVAFVH
ncbi:hypothetical protein ACFVVP_39105 [Streptomyces sp. NPDC058128]|uniref:hypothetical protein n=1 Tax=Streptomyces sp. NPDC058128 TaxID=3346352 RepID=UPI0036E1302A